VRKKSTLTNPFPFLSQNWERKGKVRAVNINQTHAKSTSGGHHEHKQNKD
jgi:hypothetical protein